MSQLSKYLQMNIMESYKFNVPLPPENGKYFLFLLKSVYIHFMYLLFNEL